MKQISITDFRSRARHYFDLVETGEIVRVFRNSKPIADVVPIAADLPSWKRRIVQPLVLEGVSISRVILAERAGG